MRSPLVSLAFVSLTLWTGCVSAPEPEETPRNEVDREIVQTPTDWNEAYEHQSESTRNARARMVGYFPNTPLITHDNEQVSFYEDLLVGKCIVVNFMYTVCDGI